MKRLFVISMVVFLGFSFVIPTSSSWSAGTLKVTTPNGGQMWTTGKKYAIKWVKGNAGGTVKIQLLKSGKHHRWIAKKAKKRGGAASQRIGAERAADQIEICERATNGGAAARGLNGALGGPSARLRHIDRRASRALSPRLRWRVPRD